MLWGEKDFIGVTRARGDHSCARKRWNTTSPLSSSRAVRGTMPTRTSRKRSCFVNRIRAPHLQQRREGHGVVLLDHCVRCPQLLHVLVVCLDVRRHGLTVAPQCQLLVCVAVVPVCLECNSPNKQPLLSMLFKAPGRSPMNFKPTAYDVLSTLPLPFRLITITPGILRLSSSKLVHLSSPSLISNFRHHHISICRKALLMLLPWIDYINWLYFRIKQYTGTLHG